MLRERFRTDEARARDAQQRIDAGYLNVSKLKVLYVVHNHPSVRPGGAEAYASELYEAMRSSEEFEPILLARTGPPMSKSAQNHPGTVFSTLNEDTNQYVIYTEAAN